MIAEIAIPVLKRKKYAIIAIVATILLEALSYYLTIANVAFKSVFVLIEMDGVYFTVASLLLSFCISLFFGIYLALMIFRHDIMKEERSAKHALAGVGGTIANVIVSGCATCGAPFLAIFGAPLGLMALPLQGMEIKIVSFFLLLLSLHLLTQNIEKKFKCAVPAPSAK
jgi:hypothetical protein